MPTGFDRNVTGGIVLLAGLMVGNAVVGYANTRHLRDYAGRAAHSRDVLDAVGGIVADTRKLQAAQRAYIISGAEDRLRPFDEAAASIRAGAARLRELTADDPAQAHRAAGLEIDTGIAGLEAVNGIRREKGFDAIVQLARVRGTHSFLDPLLETLAEMETVERETIAARDEETRQAYANTVFFGATSTALGLVALGLFVWLLGRSASARARDAGRLADQKELLDATLTSIGDGVIATDTAGRVTFLNAVAETLTGWSEADARGEPLERVFRIVNASTRAAVDSPALRALRDGVVVGLANHTLLVARDGTERPIDDSAAPIRSRGAVGGAVLVFRDISDRKAAEAELARVTTESDQRKRLYETILSATPDFVYVFSLDHKVLYANDALIAMWGRGHAGAIGKTFLEIGYEPWHAEMHGREIDQVRATKRPIRGEVPFHGTLGRRDYDYIFVPVFGPDGEVEAVAGTTRDVTDRKRAEEELRQLAADLSEAGHRKDEFLATLAHELRNPLAPVRNGVSILQKTVPPEPRALRTLEVMERQIAHLVHLVDDLMDVSRVSRGKVVLRPEPTDLRAVVESALEATHQAVEAAGHELDVRLPADPLVVEGDGTRLSQVVANLLSNAAKYTPPGGRIELTAARDGGEAVVRVADNGIGIPADMLPKIFDMFTQVGTSLDRAQGGLGIGLTLVRRLVELHGGRVEADSDGAGRGSAFTVRLPLAPASNDATAPGAASEVAVNGTKLRVLVVDDNEDAADSLALLLGLAGHEVTTAHDGLRALAAAVYRPDLILLDIGMPGMNGYEVAARIRATPDLRGVVLVALTGWGQDDDRRRTREAGFDHHLVKPADPAALAQILAAVGTSAASRTLDDSVTPLA